MARLPRAMFPRRRRREAVRRHTDKIDTICIAGVTCRRVAIDQDGYIFQSITEPSFYLALTHKEHDDQLRAQTVPPAKKD